MGTTQNSLSDLRISERSYSPEIQLVPANFYNEKGKVAKLEAGLLANKTNDKFPVFLRAMKLIEMNHE